MAGAGGIAGAAGTHGTAGAPPMEKTPCWMDGIAGAAGIRGTGEVVGGGVLLFPGALMPKPPGTGEGGTAGGAAILKN